MPFTREDMASYESKTPVLVDDKTFDPWNPSTSVETVKTETPPVEVKPEVKAETSPTAETTPASDETATGDGSQAAHADSAPAPVEPDDDAQPPVETKDEGSPRKGSAQERIEELVAERNALRKYGEYILEQARQAREQVQTAPSPKAPAPANDPIPTLEQFQYDPVAHAQALNEWVDRQVDKRVNTAVQDLASKQDETNILSGFQSRVEQYKKANPDFDLLLSNPALPPLDRLAARQVMRLEQGPAIVHHLAKNPDLATRIARMAPEQQLIAIGRLEAQIMAPAPQPEKPAKAATPKRTVTQAPPPPTPVKAAASNSEKPEELMSMDEWVNKERQRKIAEKEEKRRMRQAMRG